MPGPFSRLKGRLGLLACAQLPLGTLLLAVTALADAEYGFRSGYVRDSLGLGAGLLALQRATGWLTAASGVAGGAGYAGFPTLLAMPELLWPLVGAHLAASAASLACAALTVISALLAAGDAVDSDMEGYMALAGLASAAVVAATAVMLRLEWRWARRSWAEGLAGLADDDAFEPVAPGPGDVERPPPPSAPRLEAPASALHALLREHYAPRVPQAGAFASAGAAGAADLIPGPPLEPEAFESAWSAAPVTGGFQCRLRRVPEGAALARHLAGAGFYVLAVGEAGGDLKCFFYGREAGGALFLAAFEIDLGERALDATFRCTVPSPPLTAAFVQRFRLHEVLEVEGALPT